MGHIHPDYLQCLVDCDLYKAGWQGPCEWPGMPNRQASMNSLSSSLVSKYTNELTSKEADAAALALFLECNRKCKDYVFPVPASDLDAVVLGEYRKILYEFFNPPQSEENDEPFLLNLGAIAKRFDVGPGASRGATGEDFYSKLGNSALTYTEPLLVTYFSDTVRYLGAWNDVEAYRAKQFGCRQVSASSMSFAAKKRTISRVVNTEPALEMIFQKGIGSILEERMQRSFGIDLAFQPWRNSMLARVGSLTGRIGTLDLKSASDCISLNLLRESLPPEPVRWFERCRSKRVKLPDGSEEELFMVSSMGNGFTFPLQTLLFTAVVLACYRALDIPVERPYGGPTSLVSRVGNYGVFGDDIVVVEQAYGLVARTLGLYGLTVNALKSFNTGLFRESCGSDFYNGHNVRGVYIKKLLDDGDLFSSINRLNRWSMNHGIPLPGLVGFLYEQISQKLTVPWDESDDAGIKVPRDMHSGPNTIGKYGTVKYKAYYRLPLRLVLPWVNTEENVQQADWTKTQNRQLKRLLKMRPKFKYQPAVAYLTAIAGRLRAGALGLRQETTRAVLRQRFTPGWDESAAGCGVNPALYRVWKDMVARNIVNF